MGRHRGRCSSKSRKRVLSPGNSRVLEYDMCHVLLDKDVIAGLDSRRRAAIVADIRRHLCSDMSAAELALVDMVHPMQVDDRGSRVEYYQRVETCP